jgi:hypothetical protein
MTAVGHTRRFRDVRLRSGLPPTADIFRLGQHFAFGSFSTSPPFRHVRSRPNSRQLAKCSDGPKADMKCAKPVAPLRGQLGLSTIRGEEGKFHWPVSSAD